jgi:hypothetical protein
MGVYLGQLPLHASTIALVLNPQIGHVSAQFHVAYDKKFTTIDDICLPGHMTKPGNWKTLCEDSTDLHIEQRQNIDSLWHTFNFEEVLKVKEPTELPAPLEDTPSITFADPVATVTAPEGASEGVNIYTALTPTLLLPETLEHTNLWRSTSNPKSKSTWHGCQIFCSPCNPR